MSPSHGSPARAWERIQSKDPFHSLLPATQSLPVTPVSPSVIVSPHPSPLLCPNLTYASASRRRGLHRGPPSHWLYYSIQQLPSYLTLPRTFSRSLETGSRLRLARISDRLGFPALPLFSRDHTGRLYGADQSKVRLSRSGRRRDRGRGSSLLRAVVKLSCTGLTRSPPLASHFLPSSRCPCAAPPLSWVASRHR